MGNLLSHFRTPPIVTGDLIEILIPVPTDDPHTVTVGRNRSHWALVESVDPRGNIRCYHLARDPLTAPTRRVVRWEPLVNILDECADIGADGFVYWRCNNQHRLARQLLAITGRHGPPPLDVVFGEINKFRDREVAFDPDGCNAEHYCTYWRYGIGWSSGRHPPQQIVAKAEHEMREMAAQAAAEARAQAPDGTPLVTTIGTTIGKPVAATKGIRKRMSRTDKYAAKAQAESTAQPPVKPKSKPRVQFQAVSGGSRDIQVLSSEPTSDVNSPPVVAKKGKGRRVLRHLAKFFAF
ncbi:unnamed protein product [Medioppia subpectinata]|uniref:Uncharacterized protein n=1 Tax=Medioppia subpectinata TaxID=1979941 RepID=A0A7R9Q035_9ACAR|nr:unnamed protein product [Medioppia subpectinata]CAG2107673.1 unnamed protein product [Medioppia subpectinata]